MHVYFEKVPHNITFFVATAAMAGPSLQVNFRINKVEGLTEEMHQILQFQCDRIGLNTRLERELSTYIGSIGMGLEQAFDSNGKNGVEDYLNRSAIHAAKTFGNNHWQTALLNALTNCEAFCEGGFRDVMPVAPLD